jgi:hypothetical protein
MWAMIEKLRIRLVSVLMSRRFLHGMVGAHSQRRGRSVYG